MSKLIVDDGTSPWDLLQQMTEALTNHGLEIVNVTPEDTQDETHTFLIQKKKFWD